MSKVFKSQFVKDGTEQEAKGAFTQTCLQPQLQQHVSGGIVSGLEALASMLQEDIVAHIEATTGCVDGLH